MATGAELMELRAQPGDKAVFMAIASVRDEITRPASLIQTSNKSLFCLEQTLNIDQGKIFVKLYAVSHHD